MDELKLKLNELKEKLDVESVKREISLISKESEAADFWNFSSVASLKMKKMSDLQKLLDEIGFLELLADEGNEIEFQKEFKKIEFRIFLSGKYDPYDAIFAIHAGQGGTEACDWAEMLYRMYTRFFEKRKWKVEVIDETKGEEAGIKSIALIVKGDFAFGLLKKEAGTHRLVRLSPFNANNLRQTSFALVEVMPLLEDTKEIDVNPEDLDWDFFRSGGKGGQNVNKVSTAVRLTHRPTGIIVTCQTERSQMQNREYAMKLLKAKLWVLEEQKKKDTEKGVKGEHKTAGFGNQIRNYVLHPYHLVKDLRTGLEISKTDEVLNGNIDEFIEKEVRL